MANRYVKAASSQLNPVYSRQVQAYQQELPAINKLYEALQQGLVGQQQTQTQNIFEDAGARGILNSTIPVDQQTALAGNIAQQQGQYAAEQGQKIAGVNQNIAQSNLDRFSQITSLGDQYQQRALQREQFKFQQAQAKKQLELQRQAIYY